MPAFAHPYQAMMAFAAPAVRRAEIWRTIVGLVLAVLFAALLLALAVVPLVVIMGPDRAGHLMQHTLSVNTPAGMIGLLFSFLPQLLGLLLATLVLMRRSPLGLFGPPGAFLRNFLWVGGPLMAFGLIVFPMMITGKDVTPNLPLDQWLPWLPVALIGLLVQTATEEVVFRGYLQQQLAARFASRWLWMGLPSVLFGLMHYSADQDLPFALLTMAWATCFGLIAADLTARTGNLGAGLALHFTNNISAILLLGFGERLNGLSLYTVTPPGDMANLMYFGQDLISLLVVWLLARLMLRR